MSDDTIHELAKAERLVRVTNEVTSLEDADKDSKDRCALKLRHEIIRVA